MICPRCGYYEGDGEDWPTLCADGDVQWPCDCPGCGESFPPTHFGVPITREEAFRRETQARSLAAAVHLG